MLAVENLNVVLSRSALLDIHLEFWVVVGFLFLLLDRRWIDRRTPPEPEPEPERVSVGAPSDAPELELMGVVRARSTVPFPLWRPWRFAAGIALGAAFSVKWSGAHGDHGSADPVRGVGDDHGAIAATPRSDGRWRGRSARRASASSSRS